MLREEKDGRGELMGRWVPLWYVNRPSPYSLLHNCYQVPTDKALKKIVLEAAGRATQEFKYFGGANI
jgi:hypothetical protein